MVNTAAGERLAVKMLAGRDGIVDGHDLESFTLKPRQINAVHTHLPRLSPFYVQVVGEWRGHGWAAYAMPFHQGDCVTARLRRVDPDVPRFFRELGPIFSIITEFGYAVRQRPAPSDHFLSIHVDRLRRRLPVLRRHLDPELFTKDFVIVNGRQCATLPRMLGALSDNRLLAALQPPNVYFPVHGDLNLGNLMMRHEPGDVAFVILDPRGDLHFWDPIYDFAKSLFSLTVFERAMESGFSVTPLHRRGGRPNYQVALRDDHVGYLTAAVQFVSFLERLPFIAELDRVDPGWRRRLLYAHAVHCIAEAACRLSDRKPRAYGETRGWDACLLLAQGLYLVGLVLLNDLLTAPEGVSPGEHLGWLGE